ncbi:restriction endonuclease [Singulisphaera sp. PoT]|uniref:restriction endonuclease n=1 Tax=Singulisphaera sp. PoT TaxID=3411797 RepID=UPI003BF60BDA
MAKSRDALAVLEVARSELPRAESDLRIAQSHVEARHADYLRIESTYRADQAALELARRLAAEQAALELERRLARADLSSQRWRGLTGIEFEDFLADVFRFWNYQIETTPVTGDQGVDLIVIKDGRRIAVQAKGYPNSTVGNGAVQEVHTGKSYHHCHVAVVITNSTFTRKCKELAAKVGCLLVDRNDLPTLIHGNIRM